MASLSGANKIVLKAGYSEGATETDEGIASGAISPGMNINLTNAAESEGRHTYIAAATPASGTTPATPTVATALRVAMENSLVGLTVNDAYSSGDDIIFHNAKPGDIIQVLVASGQTIAKGNTGKAIASGKWNVSTTDAVVEFLEASSGALAADTLARARVL